MKAKLESNGSISPAMSSMESESLEMAKPISAKEIHEKIEVAEDIFEPRESIVGGAQRTSTALAGPYLQLRHFDAEIEPKNAGHLQFLQGCTSYDGSEKIGKVHANLDLKFWSWLSELDPALIKQAYTDAALLRGEPSSSAASCVALVQECGLNTDWDAATIQKLQKYQENAIQMLEKVYAEKAGRKLVHHSKRSKTAYSQLTEGDLKYDYAVYRRSVRFCNKILAASQLVKPSESHAAVTKLMKKDGHDGQAVVIALDRLQRLFEQQAS